MNETCGKKRMRPMRLMAVAGVAVVVSAVVCSGSEPRSAAFIAAIRCERAPVIDGKLDDPAWQAAVPVRIFYEYVKPQPGPGALKSEARMLYDEKGVYLAVVNTATNMANLRAAYMGRDAEDLWTDDCNEIYFDSAGAGIGWTKFTINSIGTMGDSRRVDPAVSLPDWNGSGWQVRTSKRADAWAVEAFFPWADLGDKRAEPGTFWRFCLVRYAYTSGRFIGVTSSPGGFYDAPQNFSVLMFCGSRAFRELPFSCGVIYHSPLNAGPANFLFPSHTGYQATMVQGFPYDDLAPAGMSTRRLSSGGSSAN